MAPATPSSSDRSTGRPAGDAASPARYAYLLARLRNRQITMEEATELFGVLQSMLRDSQAARARAERAAPVPPPGGSPTPTPLPAARAPAPPSDDWLLLGLLALGAGAGLGAAFARRLGIAPAPERGERPVPR